MAESPPTTGELFKAKAITAEDLHAAVDAYIADPTTTLFLMGEGYGLDLAEAVRTHEPSRKAFESPDESPIFKRTMVQTAIILARPAKR
ncbi:hypothetical protein [Methylobacterium soli]|uniref:Uncharacterized protein n=1 Tax=Methylobacterium soli TaxID=553447 RepID=A0A6L3SNF8_9HYPH|nr:hypothetical protein [Methylobacterium soli]KAB1068905.1 hypothetical protein F6X53_31250 [Methylobacterium soli]GJE46665.1 hypothetical protein AEGHOMDF_5872 [Methylobacterium soli]